MKWLTLEQIKAQLRIEEDFTAENTLLTGYGETAEDTVLDYLNRPYQEVIETWGNVPNRLVQASLLLVDLWYQRRSPVESASLSIVPYGNIDLLLKPFMRLTSQTDSEEVTVALGSETKIEFTVDMPDKLTLADVDFTGKVINVDDKDKALDFTKEECIMVDEGASYVVLIDTETLGVGSLMLKLTVQIPDTDFPNDTRKQVVNFYPSPRIRITG